MTIVFLRTRQDDRDKEELQKVEDIRGSPLSVGTMEEIIDDNHCIISTPNGPEYYVAIMSFVDRDQLEPKCTVLLHNKVRKVSASLDDLLLLTLSLCDSAAHGSCRYLERQHRPHGERDEGGQSATRIIR